MASMPARSLVLMEHRLSQPATSAASRFGLALKTEIVVVGAGQAGLSAVHHLKRWGLAPDRGFMVLDRSPKQGGAWQCRWHPLLG